MSKLEIKIARGLDDLMMVYAIRAAVYMAEQECPYAEEFDGNDACATHFIGLVDGEPAGCVRSRFFHDFAKIERLAVLKRYRKSGLVFELCRSLIDHARRKGFPRIYGQAREGLEGLYERLGATPTGKKLSFSGFNYTEMLLELEPSQDAITLDSGGYVILRPEGDWDRPGILEISATRPVRDPGENVVRSTRVMT